MKAEICIVTPDIVGPIKNGGIGTHCFFLATALQREGHSVTVLFTGPFEIENSRFFKSWFLQHSIAFLSMEDMPSPPASLRAEDFVERSYRIYLYLRARQFDVVHFQEWQANGFHTLQAKRTAGDFERTRLIVTMHSSTEWIKEGMREWLSWPISEAKLQWCERYCCQYADLLVSPSLHMFSWAQSRNWALAANRRVAQYCIDRPSIEAVGTFNPGRLAFFGRLEERKGIRIFCEAIKQLSPDARARMERLYFVGKPGATLLGAAEPYITRTMNSIGVPWEIHTNFDSFKARRFLKDAGAVAFIPSLLDNLPYTVIECCCDGIPVFASGIGGIPELLPPEQLHAPTIAGIAASVEKVLAGKVDKFDTLYRPERSREEWLDLTLLPPQPTSATNSARAPQETPEPPAALQPLVSICVPYFNYGKYLGAMLESLHGSTYTNFEVIVVDDGSSEASSRTVFDALLEKPPYEGIRFFRKKNSGVGDTRNFAAARAEGDFLIFLDADNLATPMMIEKLVRGILRSGVDVLCCHFKAFDADKHPDESTVPAYIYAPIGPAVEVGWSENVFGDANFIMRRSVFEQVGGFGIERDSSWEDFELLARLALRGFKLDVLPEALLWYRHTPEGFSRNTSVYLNRRRVLKTYAANLPPNLRWLFESVLPSFGHDEPSTVGTRVGKAIGNALNHLVDWALPPNSARRERAYRAMSKLIGSG